jgi:eukaryotic-like serine/threonine-protein kinase
MFSVKRSQLPYGILVRQRETINSIGPPGKSMYTLEPGATLDHYRIDAVVAHTQMSVLYKATDIHSGKLFAIKVPNPEMEADSVLLERFKREEEIGRQLDHPGVVKTFNGEERSRLYMVIEWVDGQLLRTILNEQKKLPIDRATTITQGICDALDYMHKRGIIHRDLKPENVMVTESDQIKLIDFGIAMKEDARRLTFVNVTSLLGTPDYISPEQVKGVRGDQRSDIYSVGIIFYEMLTGRVPFVGSNPLAVMNERVIHDVKPPSELAPEISPALEEIIYRALQREPRHRYATASEMMWDLEHQDQVGVELRGVHPPGAGARRSSINKKLLLYAAMVLVPVLLFGIMLALARK